MDNPEVENESVNEHEKYAKFCPGDVETHNVGRNSAV